MLADISPKLPHQIVIIPAIGFAERDSASLHDLDLRTQLAIRALETTMQKKMETFSGISGVRGIIRGDGYAIPNHPHTVMFPALRGESIIYTEPPRPAFTDEPTRRLLVERTVRNLALSRDEAGQLDTILGNIQQIPTAYL